MLCEKEQENDQENNILILPDRNVYLITHDFGQKLSYYNYCMILVLYN